MRLRPTSTDGDGSNNAATGGGSRTARERLTPFLPLLVLAGLLSAAGMLVDRTIGVAASIENTRVFFQLVLAGALMATLRNEVGLKTYGLFAPVIIAFIMVGAGPLWGLVLFLNVLVVTLIGRRVLRPLKLGTAPRVAILLSVAAVSTALAYTAARAGELPQVFGSEQVFFPTIITAWYADRAATEIEERGWREPSKRLLATLVAVVACYTVIVVDAFVDVFAATPAAWGPLLLAIAYVGTRPGLRLSEFRRFSAHADGSSGAFSLAATQAYSWAARARWRLARALGRPVDDEPPTVTDVLGMKRRNHYIEAYNPPRVRPTADEKATMNRRLTDLDVPSPETFAVVESADEVDAAERVVADRDEFVIKPSNGYGGEGIVVVTGRDGDVYDTSKGPMTGHELRDHVRRIVDGHYSGLDGEGTAVLEEKLTPASFMRDLHGDGVADIRVIVFRGYPVMAMTRLPTEESDGAANLHLGAVGVGLSLADGTPLGAYQQSRDRELDAHPDTGASLAEFRVPNWDGILETATAAAAASGLGYTGVDVVLAEGDRPKVLEVNVRPGLGIQDTVGSGLYDRLDFVESLPSEYGFADPDTKISLAREWAAADFESDVRPAEGDLRDGVSDAGAATDAGADGAAIDAGIDGAAIDAGADGADDETDPTEADVPGDLGGASAMEGDDAGEAPGPLDRFRSGVRLGATGVLLTGAWIVGFPVLVALFLLVPVGFVGWLCWQALGLGDGRLEGAA